MRIVDFEPRHGEPDAEPLQTATLPQPSEPLANEPVTIPTQSPPAFNLPRAIANVALLLRCVAQVPIPSRRSRSVRWLIRHVSYELIVAVAASALSIGFYAWYAHKGVIFAYGDSLSYMMIARWVFASRTPGLAQLGTVWLPLHTMLMLPLIWIDALWRDGLAGSLPSMIAYVVGATFMFRLGRLLYDSMGAACVAALSFMLNPSLLYMQATAMSESELLCLSVVAIYFAVRWARTMRPGDLVKSAAAIAAGTLVRYDAWALAACLALAVGYIAWRKLGRVGAEAQVILFGSLAFSGCAAWLLYNQVIFGNALAFQNGIYSPSVQQQSLEASYGLVTRHNAGLSLAVYSQAALDTIGWPIAVVAVAGLIALAYRRRFGATVLPAYALLVPLAFNALALFSGNTVLFTPEFKAGAAGFFFNERYGMAVIPVAALFLAFWAAQRRELLVVTALLVVLCGGLNPALGTPYALQDPLHGLTAQGRELAPRQGTWLASHYRGGAILISGGPFEAAIFYSGLPGHDFVTDGNGPEFYAAVAHPEATVSWIVMTPTGGNYDAVWDGLHDRQDWRRYFALVQVIGPAQIYERVGSS